MGTNPSEDNTLYCRSRSFEDFFYVTEMQRIELARWVYYVNVC